MHTFKLTGFAPVKQGTKPRNRFIKVIILLLILSPAVLAQNKDINIPVDEKIRNLEVANHKLWSSYNQPKNTLEAFWAEWSEKEKQEAESWFLYSEYNPQKLRREIQWFESEYEADKQNWENIKKTYGLLDDQKERYHKFLQDENRLLTYYKIYYNNKLRAIRMYGGNWVEEFTKECLEDYLEVFKETILNISDEIKNCFTSVLTEAMRAGMIQTAKQDYDSYSENADALINKTKSCITDIPLQSLIFALEAAIRRQFIKEMKERNIYEEVARYWWDKIIMNREKIPIYEESIKSLASLEGWIKYFSAEKIKEYSAREVIPQIMEEVKEMYQKEFKERILDKGLLGTEEEKQFRQNALKSIKKTALDRTSDHINNQLFNSYSFLYDYLKRAYVISEGRYKFYQIAEKEIAKYNHIKRCLKKNEIASTPENMLEIIQKDDTEFIAWYKANCKDQDCDQELIADQTIEKLKAFELKYDNAMVEISDKCSSARESIDMAYSRIQSESSSSENQPPLISIETIQNELGQRIAALEKLKAKGAEYSVAAGIYHNYSEDKAGNICEEISLISDIPDEGNQMKESIGTLAYLSEAVEYFQQVSDYSNQLNSLYGLAEQLKNDIIGRITSFESSLSQYIKPETLAASAINPLLNDAVTSYSSVDEELKNLEIEHNEIEKEFERALTISNDLEKRNELLALKNRIEKKMKNSKVCYIKTAILIGELEKSIEKSNIIISEKAKTKSNDLTPYKVVAEAIVEEIGSDRSEAIEYKNIAQNSVSDATRCLNELADNMRSETNENQSVNDEETEALTDQDNIMQTSGELIYADQVSEETAKELYKSLDNENVMNELKEEQTESDDLIKEIANHVFEILNQEEEGTIVKPIIQPGSSSGFSELEQDGTTIRTGESTSPVYMKDEQMAKAVKDHYDAQRLSAFGTKGYSIGSINRMFNEINEYEAERNEQIRNDMRNDLLNLIGQTITQFSNIISNSQQKSDNQYQQSFDKVYGDPYKAYRDAFKTKEADESKEDKYYDGYFPDDDAVNLLDVSAGE